MMLADWRTFKSLTPRQRQFLKLIRNRLTLEQIAKEMGITVVGAKRIKSALEKLFAEHWDREEGNVPIDLRQFARRFTNSNFAIFDQD
ncbi:MAG TPA: sigma factor-like helix-turn-helix DNA-binding protein [Gemmataceae bacterium]|nr:sigma factor-like helix-turn-helix DNA-binding protein [Gemmataceae bacterium]